MTVMRTADAVRQYGKPRMRHAIESGRWQRPCRGVVVTHNGPLTPDELELVALCLCPPSSALAGLTALRWNGLTGFSADDTHVVLPEGARRPRRKQLVTHWSTELSEADIHPTREPRRTRPARSAVDAASWARTTRYARAIVLASFQQGLVNDRAMRDAMARRGPARRRGLVRESVLDAIGGIDSLPERDFDDIRSAARLPAPSRQRRTSTPNGRFYLDVAWNEFDAAAEIHGLPHHGVVEWTGDLFRANEIVITGPSLVAFTSFAVRHEKEVVADQLARLLRSRGWKG